MKEDVCHKPRISFKSAFKLALNDLKTCPSRQNQKLQGKKWAYFSNWTLGFRVIASSTFTLGTICISLLDKQSIVAKSLQGKNQHAKSHH